MPSSERDAAPSEPPTILPVSREKLQDLLDDVEADWGFEYAYDNGLAALRELRRIIGGEPNRNVVNDYDFVKED